MRTQRKLAALFGALLLVAAACGGGDDDAATTTAAGGTETSGAETSAAEGTETTKAGGAAATGDCSKPETFCIGLVTDVGKVDDKSFNQSAWTGAQEAAKKLDGQAEYVETADPKDYGKNIASFVDKKYDVIVTVGFALGEETTKQATAHPEIKFIGVDQFQGAPVANLSGLIFPEDQAGFMAGALAGLLTKTGTIGAVLGTDKVPPVVAFGKGWEAGAKYTKPDVKSITTYHPGGLDVAFSDPTWGATTAKQALDNNADIIFGAGGKTGNGALAEVAKKQGAFCVGVDTDQWETVPEAHPCLVTSAMKLIDVGVIDLATQAKDGSMKGGNFVGKVGLAPYHDFDSKIPADVKAKVTQISADVQSGKIKTGV